MNKIASRLCVVAGAAAVAVPAAAGATEFIQNGNFEQSTLPGPMEIHFIPDQYTINTPLQYGTAIAGWVVDQHVGENIFYYQNATATSPTQGSWPLYVQPLSPSFDNVANAAGDTLQPGAVQADPETGGHFVAIDGNDWSSGDSWIYQTVTGLTPGQAYQLSFYWGGVQLANWHGPTTESLKVWFGSAPLSGQSQSTPTVAEASNYFSGWMQSTMNFVAQSSTQILTFEGIGTPSGSPPMLVLDGVSLTNATTPPVSAVPESPTWATLLLGCAAMGGFGMTRRRRTGGLKLK